jgi:hypothetical protein
MMRVGSERRATEVLNLFLEPRDLAIFGSQCFRLEDGPTFRFGEIILALLRDLM